MDMTSSSPPRNHINSEVFPTTFRKNYGPGASSDDQSSSRSSAEKAESSHSNSPSLSASRSQLDSSTSSTGRTDCSNESKDQIIAPDGRFSLRGQKIPSGENLDVAAGGAGEAALAASEGQSGDDPTSAAALGPITTDEQQRENSAERSTELGDARREEGDSSRGQVESQSLTDTGNINTHTEGSLIAENTGKLIATRRDLYDGIWTQGLPISKKINVSLHEIKCQRRKNPCLVVDLSIIPCKDENSRSIIMKGGLKIPKVCSHYMWLLQYNQCSITVIVKVSNHSDNTEIHTTEQTHNIQYNEQNNDHCSEIILTDILDHKFVLYRRDITKFKFDVTVRFIACQAMDPGVPFECKDCEDPDLTEIVPKTH